MRLIKTIYFIKSEKSSSVCSVIISYIRRSSRSSLGQRFILKYRKLLLKMFKEQRNFHLSVKLHPIAIRTLENPHQHKWSVRSGFCLPWWRSRAKPYNCHILDVLYPRYCLLFLEELRIFLNIYISCRSVADYFCHKLSGTLITFIAHKQKILCEEFNDNAIPYDSFFLAKKINLEYLYIKLFTATIKFSNHQLCK